MHKPSDTHLKALETLIGDFESDLSTRLGGDVTTSLGLQETDRKLSTAQMELSSFFSFAEAWQARSRRARNQLLPIHRLPTELFVDILRYETEKQCDIPFMRPVDVDYQRLIGLSCVSTHWRKIITGTASFWATLNQNQKAPYEKTLQRSSNTLVSIAAMGKSALTKSFITAATRQPSRWAQLAIDIFEPTKSTTNSPLKSLVSLVSNATSLKRLYIHRTTPASSTLMQVPFPPCPSITVIDLKGIVFNVDVALLPRSFSQLLRLSCQDFDAAAWPVIWHLISCSPDLRELSLSHQVGNPEQSTHTPLSDSSGLELANLRSIRLSMLHDSTFLRLLNITAGVLQTAHLMLSSSHSHQLISLLTDPNGTSCIHNFLRQRLRARQLAQFAIGEHYMEMHYPWEGEDQGSSSFSFLAPTSAFVNRDHKSALPFWFRWIDGPVRLEIECLEIRGTTGTPTSLYATNARMLLAPFLKVIQLPTFVEVEELQRLSSMLLSMVQSLGNLQTLEVHLPRMTELWEPLRRTLCNVSDRLAGQLQVFQILHDDNMEALMLDNCDTWQAPTHF